MSENKGLYNGIATLRNVAALVSLIDRVQSRDHGLPGMAVFYGFSGFGKTTAATYAANRFQAYSVQVKSEWRAKFFCQAILRDMAIKPAHTVAPMLEQIAEHLARTGRPLIIDEADHLVNRKLVELTRDIHEASGAPVILIGEERLPQNLQQWERIHGRMLDWVAAEPAEMRDVTLLADIYARGVTLDDDMKTLLFRESKGSIRRICVNLARVAEFGRTRGKPVIAAADWGKQGFFTGEAPAPRRMVA